MYVCFVCFTSQSTAMVMSRWSVNLTTLFPGQAWLSGKPVNHAHTFTCNWHQPFLNNKRNRMTVENISRSITTKVWVGIKITNPGSAILLATNCATGVNPKPCYNEVCYRRTIGLYIAMSLYLLDYASSEASGKTVGMHLLNWLR